MNDDQEFLDIVHKWLEGSVSENKMINELSAMVLLLNNRLAVLEREKFTDA